jgi:hypothetical protein
VDAKLDWDARALGDAVGVASGEHVGLTDMPVVRHPPYGHGIAVAEPAGQYEPTGQMAMLLPPPQ